MDTPGPSQVRPTSLARSSIRSSAPTTPAALPEGSRTTRVSTAAGPGRSHESARCNPTGIALSAVALRNQSVSPTDASPGENGEDAASNWPDALTTKVAPTDGKALCNRNRRDVSATR